MAKIAIIILHYGAIQHTESALQNLRPKLKDHRLILVNNTQNDISSLQSIIPSLTLINNPSNRGFAAGVNQAIQLGLADPSLTHFLLFNNDATIEVGSLDLLIASFAKNPSAGIISPLLHHSALYDWGGRYNRFTAMVRHQNWPNKPKTTLKVDHVAGAAMGIKREVIERIGLFDERFFLYYEDLDFCLRAATAGYKILIIPEVIVAHAVSAGSHPIPRLFHQWRSHLHFILKHLPKTAYPTALLYDAAFYPLILLKLIFRRFLFGGR